MKINRKLGFANLIGRFIFLATFLTGVSYANALIEVDGSSTVYPITMGIAEGFSADAKNKSIRVPVQQSGTGGGYKKFVQGLTDINNSSRPMTDAERDLAKKNKIDFVELKIAYDGLVVVVHPTNPLESLDIDQLRQIWSTDGKIRTWQDLGLKKPSGAIALFGPGPSSGTLDVFKEKVFQKGDSFVKHSPTEDDNVLVRAVKLNPLAMSYFGVAYYQENKNSLKALKIAAEKGKEPVLPTIDSIRNRSYSHLSRDLFITISSRILKDSEKSKAVKQFVDFYLDNVIKVSAEVGYVPLSDKEIADTKKVWSAWIAKTKL